MDSITFFFLLFATLIIATDIAAICWLGSMFIPIIAGGGPYVPTGHEIVKDMISIANLKETDTVIDLGSGDGRILIAATRAGATKAIGYEIHPGLVKLSRQKVSLAGIANKVEIRKQSMWKADLSETTVVFLYQIPYSMEKLRDKIETELPKGTRIISNAFEIPERIPISKRGKAILYIV
ncbi:MAG: 50S ribosomal protein L11 methyltransferase [Parcubacteria group bacterium]|nr:50S ribosomal protein L11 methyltransferase [Parcubacteria group bacterium]